MKKLTILSFTFYLLLIVSCSKEETKVEDCSPVKNAIHCDLSIYSGNWQFRYTNLQDYKSSTNGGQIEKSNDSTLTIKFLNNTNKNISLPFMVTCESGNFHDTTSIGSNVIRTTAGIITEKEIRLYHQENNSGLKRSYRITGTKN